MDICPITPRQVLKLYNYKSCALPKLLKYLKQYKLKRMLCNNKLMPSCNLMFQYLKLSRLNNPAASPATPQPTAQTPQYL